MTTVTDTYYANTSILRYWGRLADVAMRQLIRAGRPFTADDFNRLMAPVDAQPTTRNAVGSTFAAYRQRGLIKPVGFVISTSPKRKGGIIRQWIKA